MSAKGKHQIVINSRVDDPQCHGSIRQLQSIQSLDTVKLKGFHAKILSTSNLPTYLNDSIQTAGEKTKKEHWIKGIYCIILHFYSFFFVVVVYKMKIGDGSQMQK